MYLLLKFSKIGTHKERYDQVRKYRAGLQANCLKAIEVKVLPPLIRSQPACSFRSPFRGSNESN